MNPEVSHVPADQPGVAIAEEGIVLLDGPHGTAIAMTPEAATITGYSLIAAAEEARRYDPDA
jgi:hypothetical protein